MFLVAYFVLQLHFWLSKMSNHQEHALEVFNRTAHKVVKDANSYANIQMNNAYYKEVFGQKVNKRLGFSAIYLTEEQYYQVKISMYFALALSLFRCGFCGSGTASMIT
jgi:hypothetical protein